MAIETSFTIKQVNVDEALKQAQAKAKISAAKIDHALNKSGSSKNKMTEQLKDGLKQANKLGVSFAGKLKDLISGNLLTSLFAVAIAVITKAVQQGWNYIQSLTLSMEQRITLMNDKLSNATKEYQNTVKDNTEEKSLIEQLKALNKEQNKTATTYIQMQAIIKQLQGKYGDLGLKIDKTTGKIKGLDNALVNIDKLMRKDTFAKKGEQVIAAGNAADAQAKRIFDDKRVTIWTKARADESRWGKDTTKAKEAVNYWNGNISREELEKRNTDIKKLYANLDKVKQQQASAKDEKQLEMLKNKEQYLQAEIRLRSKLIATQIMQQGEATNPTSYKKWQQMEKALSAYIEKLKELQKLAAVGASAGALSKEQLQQITALYAKNSGDKAKLKSLDDAIKKLKKEMEQQRNLPLGHERQQVILNQKKAAEDAEADKYEKQAKTAEQKRASMQGELKQLSAKQEKGTLTPKEAERLLSLTKQNLAYEAEITENKAKAQQHRLASLKIEQQLQNIELQRKKYLQDMAQSDNDALAVMSLQLQGKYEEAAQLQLINDLKKQGIKLDEKQLAEMAARKKALKSLQIKQTLQDELKQMRNSLAPKNKENEFKRRKQQLERQSGKNLTAEQEQMLKRNIELKFNMQDLEKLKPNLSNLDIRTNELTARGGFQTGAVTADLGVINSQIRDYAAMQVRLLQRMDSKLNTNGGGY